MTDPKMPSPDGETTALTATRYLRSGGGVDRGRLEVHCVACGDRWEPSEAAQACTCGRSTATPTAGSLELFGPIEAIWHDGDEVIVSTGATPILLEGAPTVRRRIVPPLL